MIRHIVLIQFKNTLSSPEIEEVFTKLANLQKVIPQILKFTWGENNSPENLHQGYMYGFAMDFKNHIDRDIYLEHPEHLKIAEYILPRLQDGLNSVVVFDYSHE